MLIWKCCLLLSSILVHKNVKITFYLKAGKKYAEASIISEMRWNGVCV